MKFPRIFLQLIRGNFIPGSNDNFHTFKFA